MLLPRWLGAITNTWFSIARARSRGSQWSLPVGGGERRRQHHRVGTAVEEGAEELREAQVVARRHADPKRSRVGDHDVVAGGDRGRLPVGGARDVDVEEVDLAVGRRRSRRERRSDTRCCGRWSPRSLRSTMLPASSGTRCVAAKLAGPRHRRTVERLRAVSQLGGAPPPVEQLGQRDELGARHRPPPLTSFRAIARFRSLSGVEHNCTAATRISMTLLTQVARDRRACRRCPRGRHRCGGTRTSATGPQVRGGATRADRGRSRVRTARDCRSEAPGCRCPSRRWRTRSRAGTRSG